MTARSPDRHRFRPVLGELEDLCHCATCGLPRDHATHDQDVAGPPDLAHAIQAAKDALWEQKGLIWSPAAIQRQAQLCVEAAAPVLLQATRDRLAEAERGVLWAEDRNAGLEVYAADLHQLLKSFEWSGRLSDCPYCGHLNQSGHTADCRLAAALQTDPPARGRAILEEVERLREDVAQLDHARQDLFAELRAVREGNDRLQEFQQAIIDAFGEFRWDRVSAALVALHAPALDLGAAREEDGGG